MAGIEGDSLEADLARIRAALVYSKVGSSLNNETIKSMLAGHKDEEQRVDLVLLELEDSLGIALTDPTQVQSWQELSQSRQHSQENFSDDDSFYTPKNSSFSQTEPMPNQEDVDMDIALDRETLLLRKELTTLRYNEIYIFLRAHRDEPDRVQLARNYFEQERKRLESERSVSPPSPRFPLNPYKGSPVSWPVSSFEYGEKDSVAVAGLSFDRRVAPEGIRDEAISAPPLLKNKGTRLVKPGSATAMSQNLNDILPVIDDEDNDPTFGWDLFELTQILSNVPEDKLFDSLWKYRQQGDRVRLVISDFLDSEVVPESPPTTQNAPITNLVQSLEEDNPTQAKRAKRSEPVAAGTQGGDHSSTEARTAVIEMKPDGAVSEAQGAAASSSTVSNGVRPKVHAKVRVASGSSTATNNHKEAAEANGVKCKQRTRSGDTNPNAKNSTRAPAKGKALAKPASPPVPESNNTIIQSNNEEAEDDLNEVKIERAISLFRQIIERIPAIHALYAAHQAAEMVEGGWDEAQPTSQTAVENLLKSACPNFKDVWLVPKPEPGVENATNIDCLRQTLLNKIVEEQVANAVQILPNIDPEYMEEKISAFNGCEILIENFLAGVFEDPKSHPSIAEFQKRQRCVELAKKVWSAEDFLENYEDPISYFYDPKRYLNFPQQMEAKYRTEATFYLRKEFPYTYERDIQKALRNYWGNTVLMCNSLRNGSLPRRKIKRTQSELTKAGSMTCPRLIEEVNFLRVEHEIRAFLDNKQKERDQALSLARRNNQLLECTICCENELVAMDFISCPAKHMFCKTCVRRHVEEIMGMVKCHFPCLDPSCDKEFQLRELQVVLKSQVFKRLTRRLQAEEIACANIDGLEMCPFCDFAAIPPEGDKIFQCLNPECSKQSCRLCQEEAHIPLSCQELVTSRKVDKLRTYMEDKMTEALLRECPRCRNKFVKSDGCNKIVCPCGALSCYICRKEVKDYSHFDGQGATTGKCPLWTNTEAMHQIEVRTQAVKTMQELEQQNPGVKLDKLLPDIPSTVARPGNQPGRAGVAVAIEQAGPAYNPLPRPRNPLQPGQLGAAPARAHVGEGAVLVGAHRALEDVVRALEERVRAVADGVRAHNAVPAYNPMPRPRNPVQPGQAGAGQIVQMGQQRARGGHARNGAPQ